jgi:hypothetical protein
MDRNRGDADREAEYHGERPKDQDNLQQRFQNVAPGKTLGQ